MMSPVMAWSVASIAAAAIASVLSTAARSSRAIEGQQRSLSFSSSVGPVTPSVIASLQAHGADDRNSPKAGPNDFIPIAQQTDKEWILDLAVFWRWPGNTPAFQQGSVGDELNGHANVHRIVVAGRALRVQFDPQADTVQIGDGLVVPLEGANVLFLDVREWDVMVIGTARVDAWLRTDAKQEPAALLIEQSPEVAAFVSGTGQH